MTTTASPARSAPGADDFDPFAGPAIVASIPTTAAQREIWAATCMGDEASLAFNEAVTVTLRGALDAGALRAAVRELVARHEALRATVAADGLTLAVLEPPAEVPVARHDWSALPGAERDAARQALLARVVAEPFDLVRGPLARFDLARLAADDHLLVVAAHHVVCDGWSFGVVATELAALYTAARRGEPARLAEAPRLADYALAAQGPEARAAEAEAEGYWTALLRDAPTAPELPADRARPATRTFGAGRTDHVLPRELVQRAARAGGAAGASLFATLFAAFGAMLHRLTGEEDVVVGIPAAGQPAAGAPGLVGHLVHLLPVRLRVQADAPFATLLAATRSAVLDAHEHHALTLGSLLARLPLARDPSRPPLVSVVFNLERGLGPSALPFDGLAADMRAVPRSRELFELFVNAVELDGAVTLECQYNAALFDGATVAAWLEAFEQLLASAADAAETPVGRLAALPPAQRARIARWNDTARAVPAGLLGHHALERSAARAPDAVALEFEGATLTYAALDARANRIARRLRALGVRRGAMVGLCLPRGPEMVAALFGVLKAGGTYVPLDPDHPAERLAFTARDAALAALVTDGSALDAVPADARPGHVLLLDRDAAAIDAESADALPHDDAAATPDTPAYVIYTSGSSGTPKGCLCTHRGLANFFVTGEVVPALGAHDVCVALATLAFDASLIDLLLPLAAGARVVIASREVAADGLRLRRLLEDARATFVFATPATWRLLLAAGWEGGSHLTVGSGAEALPRDLADALLARARTVWNAYGPTEATVWGSAQRLPGPGARVTIGRPLPNVRYHVLDVHRQPVPVGVPGELYIGGMGVAAGYLNRPELTAERFLPDPERAGERLYRTGDVVRWLPDGDVDYLGRNDDQVKLRGYRIELGEIESRLADHAGARAAAVVVREDTPDDRRLVAYLVPAEGAAPTDAELRAHLRAALPDYMVPQAFVRLAKIPLTPSGKVDRRALPAPQASDAVRGDDFVAPRTDAERLVAGLWAEALRVGRLGARDDFFQLGGHSLMASQVLARLRRDHGVELPYRRIFEAPTVERFAVLVEQAMSGSAAGAPDDAARSVAAPIPHDPARTRAPLSVIQRRTWRLHELDPATAATHVHAAAWRLRGPVDAAAVQGALDDFVARHDQMRTRFAVEDGAPVQLLDPDARLVLERVDFGGVPAHERDAALERYFADEEDRPFDPGAAPLFRASLVTFAPDDHLLYTLRHGLIWDGWSFDIFLAEFRALYEARALGRDAALPRPPITYGDFAAWQEGHLASPEMARQVAWWREHLGGELPVLELPADRPRPAQPSYKGARTYLSFTRAEVDRLNALAQQHGATLFMLLLSGYNALLHRYSGQRALLVGTPVRGRTRAETEQVVGAFVNTVMLRFDVDPEAPFAALLARVRDVTLDAFGHQDMPFELLGNKVPVVRALFSMQDARGRPAEAAGVRVEQVHVPQRAATNDLMLWTMETADGLIAVLNFSTDLFERATAERFLAHLRGLLLSLLDDPRRAVGRLPLLTEAERRAALGAGAEAARAHPSVLDGVLRAAAARPDAPAVRDGAGAAVSYARLLGQAAAVRAALAERGLGPGARVAVLADDPAPRAAAVLGALAARGAVLLLDPRDPAPYNDAVAAAAGVDAVLVATRAPDALGPAAPRVALDALDALAPAAWLTADAPRPDDVALLLHDVGADGRVVPAPLTHAALDAAAGDLAALLGVSDATVAVPLHAPAAAAAPLELLVPLAAGATLVAAPDGADADGELLADLLADVGATLATAPAATWRELEDARWAGAPALTAVVTDDAPPALLDAVAARVGRVVTAYGHPAAGGWNAAGGGAAGYDVPLGGARLFVLDAAGEVAAPGVAGWLHVGGPAARALPAGDPRLVPDPLDPAARAVRTGDRARRGADGRVTLVARDHDRHQHAGRAVALAAVEGALRGHAGVADAAVAVREDASGARRLVAFVVPAAGGAYTETELRRCVRARLPEAALPQRFVEIGAVPRDAAGAVLRDRLPADDTGAAARAYAPPATETERRVAALWQEMLGVPRAGLADNFFDLGGYSLLCFRFVDRAARETGARVSPRIVLLGTLQQVAAALDEAAGGAPGAAPVAVPAGAAGVPATGGLFGRLKGLLSGPP